MKGHGGKLFVGYRTKKKKSKPVGSATASPSLQIIFNRQKVRRPIEAFAGRRLLIEFNRSLKVQLRKIKRR